MWIRQNISLLDEKYLAIIVKAGHKKNSLSQRTSIHYEWPVDLGIAAIRVFFWLISGLEPLSVIYRIKSINV